MKIKFETCGIKYRYCDCFIEYPNFKDDLIECKYLRCNKSYQHKLHENLKQPFSIHTHFLTMVTISLFYCCGKVFILMNT